MKGRAHSPWTWILHRRTKSWI